MHTWFGKGHPNLVAYYDFSEGKGNVLRDKSGTDATLHVFFMSLKLIA